jgi:NAD(P)-dependent dehydrogenase (short-subunit alcohol dehydrogenase family)
VSRSESRFFEIVSVVVRIEFPLITVPAGRFLYCAQSVAAVAAGRGIRVNAISPGPVESALLARNQVSEAELKQTKDWIQNQILIKRFAKPDEIAEVVLYLCSPASTFVVGSELVIDGGMTL